MEQKEREISLQMAELAERAERYQDMVKYMKKVATSGKDLNSHERNLLGIAYRNVTGSHRASWRILSSIEKKERKKPSSSTVEWRSRMGKIKSYRERVQIEFEQVCKEILELIENHLLKCAETAESKVFYNKTKGDYSRYLAETKLKDDPERDIIVENAREAYLTAQEICENEPKALSHSNPVRLGLALNFAVFYYEILREDAKAIKMSRNAVDAALSEIDNHNQDDSSRQILQLIKRNLALWNHEEEKN